MIRAEGRLFAVAGIDDKVAWTTMGNVMNTGIKIHAYFFSSLLRIIFLYEMLESAPVLLLINEQENERRKLSVMMIVLFFVDCCRFISKSTLVHACVSCSSRFTVENWVSGELWECNSSSRKTKVFRYIMHASLTTTTPQLYNNFLYIFLYYIITMI